MHQVRCLAGPETADILKRFSFCAILRDAYLYAQILVECQYLKQIYHLALIPVCESQVSLCVHDNSICVLLTTRIFLFANFILNYAPHRVIVSSGGGHMNSMNERVKYIRKSQDSDSTLERFGKRIGLSKTAISDIENGRRGLTDQTFISICREFSVNPDWLRDGSGEPFLRRSRDEEIEAFFHNIQMEDSNSFKKRFVSMLSRLDEAGWILLEKMALELVEKHENMEDVKAAIDTEVDAYRRDLEMDARRKKRLKRQ